MPVPSVNRPKGSQSISSSIESKIFVPPQLNKPEPPSNINIGAQKVDLNLSRVFKLSSTKKLPFNAAFFAAIVAGIKDDKKK